MTDNRKTCNCRNKNLCPLDGKCLTNNVIYKATVTTASRTTSNYIGMTENSSFEKETLENEDWSTKHPNLENRAPKTRKRSTQISKTKHPKLENGAPKARKRSTQKSKTKHPKLETCLSLKTRDSLLWSHQQQESSTITNGMQLKTIQVELRGVANAFPSPWLLAISELCRTLGRVSDLNYREIKGQQMGKHSAFRIRSFQAVDPWQILQFNRKTEKYFKEFIWFFFCWGEGVATRRLPCLRYGSHYLEVEICHRWTLLSANLKFSGWKSAKTPKTP